MSTWLTFKLSANRGFRGTPGTMGKSAEKKSQKQYFVTGSIIAVHQPLKQDHSNLQMGQSTDVKKKKANQLRKSFSHHMKTARFLS